MQLETLKEIANENIEKILDALEIEYIDKYDYFQAECPIHNGDNPTAFSWVKSKGYFRCFTHKCERGGSDVFDLVSKVKKCSFVEAKRIVKEIVAGDYDASSDEEMQSSLAFKRYIKNNQVKKSKFKIYDPKLLTRLKEHNYLTDRGFSVEAQKEFKIGYCVNPKSKFYRRMCIPVFDDTQRLIGFTARAVFDFQSEKKPKWVHTAGMPKSEILFNMNRAKKYISEQNQAILVEGPLDVLKLYMAGIKNVVAVLGSSLSGPQRSLLLKYECFDIITGFDSDEVGEMCGREVYETCHKYFNISKYKLPKNKDFGDLSVEEINNLEIIRYE